MQAMALAGVVDGAQVGIGFLGPNLRFVAANDALAARLGTTRCDRAVAVRAARSRRSSCRGAAGRRAPHRACHSTLGAGRDAHRVPPGARRGGNAHRHRRRRRRIRRSTSSRRRLRSDAETDGLTGLVNHRVFQERLMWRSTGPSGTGDRSRWRWSTSTGSSRSTTPSVTRPATTCWRGSQPTWRCGPGDRYRRPHRRRRVCDPLAGDRRRRGTGGGRARARPDSTGHVGGRARRDGLDRRVRHGARVEQR